jgi:hypothetical protein
MAIKRVSLVNWTPEVTMREVMAATKITGNWSVQISKEATERNPRVLVEKMENEIQSGRDTHGGKAYRTESEALLLCSWNQGEKSVETEFRATVAKTSGISWRWCQEVRGVDGNRRLQDRW